MSCCCVFAQVSLVDAEASESKARPVLPQCSCQKEQQTKSQPIPQNQSMLIAIKDFCNSFRFKTY